MGRILLHIVHGLRVREANPVWELSGQSLELLIADLSLRTHSCLIVRLG